MIMVIIGICGKMGNCLADYFEKKWDIIGVDLKKHPKYTTYSSIDLIDLPIDVVADFSSVNAKNELIKAINKNVLVLSGTTGYSFSEIDEFINLGKEKFFWSANYAGGIFLFYKLCELVFKDYDIFDFIEIHAKDKKDKPSGTAKMIAKKLTIDENKIQSLRINQANPVHEIIFSSDYERIILRHEVMKKDAFLIGFEKKLNEMREKNDKEAI